LPAILIVDPHFRGGDEKKMWGDEKKMWGDEKKMGVTKRKMGAKVNVELRK